MTEILFKTERAIKAIDCRAMFPPEPMEVVLEAVEKLNGKNAILMIHRKEPFPLYSKLEERGCLHDMKVHSDGTVQILIWQSPTWTSQNQKRITTKDTKSTKIV